MAFHSVNPSNQAMATSLGVVQCSMGKKVNTYVGIVSGDLNYERDICSECDSWCTVNKKTLKRNYESRYLLIKKCLEELFDCA